MTCLFHARRACPCQRSLMEVQNSMALLWPRWPMWIPLGPTRDPSQNHVNLLVPCGMSGLNGRLQAKSLSTRKCAHDRSGEGALSEDTKRFLDYHGTTPVDQSFRHCDSNLCHLKTVALVEVQHLTMVIVLDEDHTHYSDVFGNIFE